MLGWEPHKLARRAKVHSLIVKRAESVASEPPITAYQAALIKQALVNAGVEFTNGREPGVKLNAELSDNVRGAGHRMGRTHVGIAPLIRSPRRRGSGARVSRRHRCSPRKDRSAR